MIRRPTWILLAIFVVLAGFAWFFQKYQADKAENAATATPTITKARLYNFDSTEVKELNISSSAGEQIDLYRDPTTAQWAIRDLPADQADSFHIESISSQLFSIQIQESITQTPPLDSIGLVTPAYTIAITKNDGNQLITAVGSKTPIGTGYYVQTDDGQVVIVDNVVMDDVLNLLTEPPLIPTPTPEVTPTETTAPLEGGTGETPSP